MCGKNLLTKGGNYTVCMTEIKSQSSNQDAFCNELSDQDFCKSGNKAAFITKTRIYKFWSRIKAP